MGLLGQRRRRRKASLALRRLSAAPGRPLNRAVGQCEAALEGRPHWLRWGVEALTQHTKALSQAALELSQEQGAAEAPQRLDAPAAPSAAAHSRGEPPAACASGREAGLSLAMRLPCGRLRPRRTPCYIAQEEMTEGTFGRPFLEALGLCLDDCLRAALAHCGAAGKPGLIRSHRRLATKGAAASSYPACRGLRLEVALYDPAPLAPSASGLLSKPTRCGADSALAHMASRTRESGMPPRGLREP